MYDYDAEYLRLRAAGLPAWQGRDFHRALARLTASLDNLAQSGALPQPEARALEIGCGNGVLAMLLARRGYEVCGVDISQAEVDWARERFAEAGLEGTFQQGDVCNMSVFNDASFDIVMDGQCLHCLIGHDRGTCLKEIRRILAPEGVFVVSSMCGEPKSEEAKASFDARSLCLLRGGYPYRTLKPLPELCRELTDAGFEVLDAKLGINPWVGSRHHSLPLRRAETMSSTPSLRAKRGNPVQVDYERSAGVASSPIGERSDAVLPNGYASQ